MKTQLKRLITGLTLLALATLNQQFSTAYAQGTAFTYQGRLNASGSPASGLYDFRFRLDADPLGNTILATVLTNAIPVTNGLFTTTIDFGAGLFTGSNCWLEVDVRTNGAASYTGLSPLQAVTPTPYALYSANASSAVTATSATTAGSANSVAAMDVSGTLGLTQLPSGVLTNNETGVTLSGSFTGNGTGLTNLNVSQLVVGGSVGFRIQPGNGGSTPNVIGGLANNSIATYGAFIGEGMVNVIQTNSQYAAIGGGEYNTILTNAYDSTISGGTGNSIQPWAYQSTIGGGGGNIISNNASYSTIGGGAGNVIQGWANGSTIGAGEDNVIQTNSGFSTIAGGNGNLIQVNAPYTAIAGGASNTVSAFDPNSFIGGGAMNTIQTNAAASTIAGGNGNLIQVNAPYTAIAGGASNTVSAFATNSFIGGGAMNTIQTNAAASTIAGGIMNTIQPNADYTVIGGGSGNTVQTNADNATIAGGLNNTIQSYDFYSAIGGGNNNSIKMNTSDAVIGGGAGNSIQSNAEYSVISGGHFNTINSNTFSAVISGGEFNAISNGATYAVIPGGSHAAAIHYGQFAFASGNFSTPGDSQASVYVLRGQENSTVYNSLYLDGGSQMLTVPTGAVWAFNILVVGGINGTASTAFNITGAIRNYGGTVAFVGTPTVTSLGADAGASTWNAQVAVTSGALDVKVKGTASNFVSWVANVRTVEVTPTY